MNSGQNTWHLRHVSRSTLDFEVVGAAVGPLGAAKAIQDKLDRLDEAFLFERSIDIETYDRHAEKLREELTLVRIERHSGQLDELVRWKRLCWNRRTRTGLQLLADD